MFLHLGLGHFQAIAFEPGLKCTRLRCRAIVLFPEFVQETNPHTLPSSVYGQKSNFSTSSAFGCQGAGWVGGGVDWVLAGTCVAGESTNGKSGGGR